MVNKLIKNEVIDISDRMDNLEAMMLQQTAVMQQIFAKVSSLQPHTSEDGENDSTDEVTNKSQISDPNAIKEASEEDERSNFKSDRLDGSPDQFRVNNSFDMTSPYRLKASSRVMQNSYNRLEESKINQQSADDFVIEVI